MLFISFAANIRNLTRGNVFHFAFPFMPLMTHADLRIFIFARLL